MDGDSKTASKQHARPKTPRLPGGLSPDHAVDWSAATRPVLKAISLIIIWAFATVVVAGGLTLKTFVSKIKDAGVAAPISSFGVDSEKTSSWTPSDPWSGKPLDVLVLGQDTRAGDADAAIGGSDPADADNHQADTAMIVHVSADRSRIDVVSLPRDSIVDQPACKVTGGETAEARDEVMLNSTFAYGWQEGGDLASAVSCELATVNRETGLDIRQYAVVDFAGMKEIIDSLDGVELCVPAAVDDKYTGLRLSPGLQRLDGMQATQYARVRHGIAGADGGDIMRSARQQAVVKALVDEAMRAARSANPVRLYTLASKSLEAVKMSPDLASPTALVGLAWSLKDVSSDSIESMTVPTAQWDEDANRVVWTDEAGNLWAKIAADEPLDSRGDDSGGSDADVDSQTVGSDSAADAGTGNSGDSGSATAAGGSDGADRSTSPVDPATGLKTIGGELIDPVTGGVVDPETGYITDSKTGSVIGLASKYLSTTVCKPTA